MSFEKATNSYKEFEIVHDIMLRAGVDSQDMGTGIGMRWLTGRRGTHLTKVLVAGGTQAVEHTSENVEENVDAERTVCASRESDKLDLGFS